MKLAAENRQLSNLLASASVTNGQAAELARLRGEVSELREATNGLARLRNDTRATREAIKKERQAQLADRVLNNSHTGTANNGMFELLAARYGTDRASADVLDELNDRIRGSRLRMIANNHLSDDLDPGHAKTLTVVYRFGGLVLTNEFPEGQAVILPPETQ